MSDDWRKEPVSKAQSDFLDKLGHTGKAPRNKGEASDLINKYVIIETANKLKKTVDYTPSMDEIEIIKHNVGLYASILIECVELGITDPPVVGMIFNKTCDQTNK